MTADKPEDEMPRFYIEAAQAVVGMPPFSSVEETGKAIEAVRQAILKAREEAFEEAAKIAEDLNEWRDASDRDMAAVARRQQPLLAEVACAIRERAKKDVFEMSEAEIDAELVSRGIDPQEATDATRSVINSVLSQAIRLHSQKGER